MAEKFIRFCISNIVLHPDDVSLEIKEDTDATRYQLTVNSDDMKRVIGRGGKTIRALQSLVRIIGIKTEKKTCQCSSNRPNYYLIHCTCIKNLSLRYSQKKQLIFNDVTIKFLNCYWFRTSKPSPLF